MTLEDFARRWDVTLERKLPGSTCSEVWAGTRGEEKVVLKLPFLDAEEAKSLPTLRAFSGHGGVSVLESDEATGACLLPLLGLTLAESNLDDEASTRIFAEIALLLRQAPVVAAPTFEQFAFDAFSSNDEILKEPIRTISRQLEMRESTTLTHGDLHHMNMLWSDEKYVAIDPKGILTDPASEIVSFVRNPRAELITPERVRRRIEIVAESWGDSYDRLAAWAWAGNVISCWWDEPNAPVDRTEVFRLARKS